VSCPQHLRPICPPLNPIECATERSVAYATGQRSSLAVDTDSDSNNQSQSILRPAAGSLVSRIVPSWPRRSKRREMYGKRCIACLTSVNFPPAAPARPVRSVVSCWSGSALVLYPKACPFWGTCMHRGARGTLDEFKTAWGGRLAHDGSPTKILSGNFLPAVVANRRIGLQSYSPTGRGWLVCNLAYTTDRHRVLQEVDARPAALAPCALGGALLHHAGAASVHVRRRGV
jgi:hypothetical protein